MCINVEKSQLLAAHKKRVRSWLRCCQCFSQGKSIIKPCLNHKEVLTLPSCLATNPTNKSFENSLSCQVVAAKKIKVRKCQTFHKMRSRHAPFLMALSLVCTSPVFTKILRSFVCFNTSRGFVFLGRIIYEFLKVSAM